jgi:hypothetical protein
MTEAVERDGLVPSQPSYLVMAMSGLVAWPIAFGSMVGAQDVLRGDWPQAIAAMGYGILGSVVLTLFPLGMFVIFKQSPTWATRDTRPISPIATSLILVAGSIALVAMLITSVWLVQLIALIPACASSLVLGALVLKGLKLANGRSVSAYALGGLLGGLIPAIPIILLETANLSVSNGLPRFAAGVLGFWCIGGAVAMVSAWIWWQVQRTRGAKEALEHRPSDLPEPQLQP